MCVCVCVFSLLVQLPCWLSGSWKGFVVICKKQKLKYFLVSGTQVKKKKTYRMWRTASLCLRLSLPHTGAGERGSEVAGGCYCSVGEGLTVDPLMIDHQGYGGT